MGRRIISFDIFSSQIIDTVENFLLKLAEKRKNKTIKLKTSVILRMIRKRKRTDFGTDEYIDISLAELKDALEAINLSSERFASFVFDEEKSLVVFSLK